MSTNKTRRSFLTNVTKGVIGATLFPSIGPVDRERNIKELMRAVKKHGPNDQMQIALIGAGGMGTADTNHASTVPGVKLVAVCDLYDGRLADAKKRWGNDIDSPHAIITKFWKEKISMQSSSQRPITGIKTFPLRR